MFETLTERPPVGIERTYMYVLTQIKAHLMAATLLRMISGKAIVLLY